MTKQKTYIAQILITLIMLVMGEGNVWAQSSGSGTSADPYIIANSTDLNTFGSKMNNNTQYWKLGADIDLGGAEWAHSGNDQKTFKGHFDGAGYTISNYKITPITNKANALFAIVQGTSTTNRAEIKNLTIDNVTISTTADLANTTYIGALAGNVASYVDFDGVSVKNVTISVKNLTQANYIGAFAGIIQKNSTIKGCSVSNPSVTVSGEMKTGASFIGGAIGQFAGTAAEGISTITKLDDTHPGLTVTSPSVTINKVSIKDCYIGAVFGRLNTFFNIDDVEVSNPTLTYNIAGTDNVALNLGTFAGGIAGNTTKEVSVTKVTVTGIAQLTLGTEAKKTTTEVKAVKAGLIGYTTTNVRLEDWTVEKTNVQVYGKLTTAASQIGAFAGNLTGAAGGPTTVKNVKINKDGTEPGCNLNITGDVKIGCQGLGGFAGVVTTNCKLEGCEVTKPTVIIGGDINTATSYIGGAIGYFLGGAGNTSYIYGLTVNEPKVDINTVTYKDQCIGAVFGRIHTYSDINGVTVGSPTLTYTAAGNPNVALNLGTFAGYITGVSAQETKVTNVTATGNAQLTIGTDATKATTEIKAVNAGFIGYTTTNVRLEGWNISNSNVQVYGSLTTTSDYFGGLSGRMESASSAPLTLKDVKISGNSTVNVTGNIGIGCYLGGFAGYIGQGNVTYSLVNIDGAGVAGVATVSVGGNVAAAVYVGGFTGYLYGKANTANSVKADNVTGGTINLTITGQTTTGSYYGGLAGRVNTMCELNNWKVTTATKLTFNNNITALSYVGGAIGSLEGAAGYPSSATGFDIKGVDINFNCDITTKGIYVGGIAGQLNAVAETNKIEKSSASGKIHTTGSHTFTPGNITYAFGGIVGYMSQSTTTFSEVNNCVSEVDFDLSGLTSSSVSGSNYNLYSGFVVGGVIGRINTPSRLPEALYYSGKIYAPSAAVAPIVGVFATDASKAVYLYDDYDYTGEKIKTSVISEDEWGKADNWYFNGYKIGLSNALLSQSDRTKNYSETPAKIDGINYLAIGENTLTGFNSINSVTKKSKTILIYDTNNKNQDKGIYPQWATNSATYPAYYMYYMQGVNRGNFVADDQVATIKEQVLSGAFALLTLTDGNADFTVAANRGIISHALTATATGADSYKWYVDGVAQSETSKNFAITPAFKGNTVAVEAIKGGKAIKRVDCKVMSVLRVTDASAAVGTKTNPYLIGSAEELQFMSYLSTLTSNTVWEKSYTSNDHYNKAYYELDDDIDLSGVDDFTPISFATGFKANNAMSLGYVFDGVFDGKQHKISGMKEEWYGGVINGNDSYAGWGLFSVVGSPMPTVKVGDSGASPAAIRNLIIDGATLTHQTGNVTFNYNNNPADVKTSNNVCIGVLAGVVLNNTKIDNIEIRNSKITDAGSSDYSLATRGLYVGGAVGSMQNSFNEVANAPINTKIQHVAAQVDITLEHPTFADATATGQLGLFNVGGIIGRYCATAALQDQAQASMPAYTLYSGNVTAPKAWISPILGATRFTGQNDVSKFENYSKIWEGNNNSDATQLTITNAQYFNFRINDKLITVLYPTNTCLNNARTINIHTDATEALETYNANKYQGVNYNARFIDSEGTTLRYLCEGVTDGVYWTWDNGFPHITDQPYKGAHLTVVSHDFTAEMENGTASAYRWEVSTDGETWTEVNGATMQTYKVVPSSNSTRLFVAIITSDGVEYRTQAEVILPESSIFNPYIAKTGNTSDGYTFTLKWSGNEPAGDFSVSYQWYESDKTTPFTGQTSATLSLTESQLNDAGGYIWCEVRVFENGDIVNRWMLVAGDLTVVYVNGNGYTGNSAGIGVDTNDGKTPQTPVKTIDVANSLLDGGPWDKNIIVVMGTLNTAEFRSIGTNPATLTGKWEGIDYEGVITIGKTSGEDVLNKANQSGQDGLHNYVKSDTKFDNLTFRCAANSADNNFIECHGNDVWFGKGLVMTNFRNLSKNHGNLEVAQNIPELTIVLTATNLNEADLQKYIRTDLRTGNNRSKPQTLTIESGHYGRIMGGRFTNKFFSLGDNTSHTILGSTRYPLWAIVNIDIDKDNPNKGTIERGEDPNKGTVTDNFTCDINCIIAGLTDGTMYGDYEINVHGGDIRYIVGGNQGNPVPNGSKTFTQPDGKSGNWGQWPNSSYFGRTVINVEQDTNLKNITIANLYAGGLGREANGSSATSIVDMYMYGHTEINMKSGTVTGNVYGGGAGGVIGFNPWDMHVPYATTDAENATNAVMNGVQYGEWGPKKAGSPLANVTLHDSDGNGGYITKQLNLGESYTTLNISGGTINGSVYGGGCGYVSNMPKEVVMQGVGSVFGTSNVNVSGGIIHGSVYGGSEGSNKYYEAANKYGQTITHIAELIGNVKLTVTGTDEKWPEIGGNIYGGGAGIKSDATKEYFRIATAGNVELDPENPDKYKTDIDIFIDLPESHPFIGNIYGGGEKGTVDGNTKILIKRGTFEGDVFGGGQGEDGHPDKAKVTGSTKVIIGEKQ